MRILSPSVNIFEYEYRGLNVSNFVQVFGIPSPKYELVPPVFRDTTLQKETIVPIAKNCNNVHYEICKEGTLDIGLVFEYDTMKPKIRPFTNFRNMLYYASFDREISLCFITKIRKFYNGTVIGEYIPQYEEIDDKLRIKELLYKDFSLNFISKKWTYGYTTNSDIEVINVIEYSSANGSTYGMVRRVESTNKDTKNNITDVQMQQTYYSSTNDVIDWQELVYKYEGRIRYLIGFNKENFDYIRFSVDVEGRPHIISKVLEWNTVISCHVFYFAEAPFILTDDNLAPVIRCEQYFGVDVYSRRIEIDVDETKHYVNAFSDFEDYGLQFLDFKLNHKYITEIRYYNEIDVLYKIGKPVYAPDYKIDSLIFEELSSDDVEMVYGGILKYYYDINRNLYKVMKFNSDEVLCKHYLVERLPDKKIDRFVNHIEVGFNIDLKYKKINKLFDGANRYISLTEPSVFWTHGCYDTGSLSAVFFEDTMTTELKMLSSSVCDNSIIGASDITNPIVTELIYKDEYNSIDFVYDYEKPKVHRFFSLEFDWNFVDITGCQPYLKYMVVKSGGKEYFFIPKYADNGKPYYVDVYEKISKLQVGNFVKRIEYLDTLGKESYAVEVEAGTYEIKYAKPYFTKEGYYNSENSHAISLIKEQDGYHTDGYFVTGDYIIPSIFTTGVTQYISCPDDDCELTYCVDDYCSDYDYVWMCQPIIDGCGDPYFITSYMAQYVDMCLVGCTEFYFEEVYSKGSDRYIDSCDMTISGCTDLYVDVDYSIEQDSYILCPGA